MTEVINFIGGLPWYVYLCFFIWLAWTIVYNQTRYLEKLKTENPEAYQKWMDEMAEKTANQKPWFMGK